MARIVTARMSPSLRVSAEVKPLVAALMAFGEHVAPWAVTFSVKGRDAYVYRAIWTTPLGWTAGSVTTPYVAGDAVFYDGKIWTLYFTPPTTHTAPGTEAASGVTASPWTVLMSNFLFSSADIKDPTELKRQNVINAELRTEIANLKTRCTTIEGRLTTAGIA